MSRFSETRFLLLFSLFLLIFCRVRIAPPDLAFYYSFAHSLLYDLDFCFANQFSNFPFAYHETYLTTEGYPANDWPMGTGLLWAPFLLIAHLSLSLGSLVGFCSDPTGYGWFERWVVTFGSTLLFGGGTIVLSYRYCLLEGISRTSVLWATILIIIGSTFTYHLYVNSADSHPPSAFFTVLFLIIWWNYNQSKRVETAFLAGLILGLAGLVRPHNLFLVTIPLIEMGMDYRGRQKRLRPQIIALCFLFLGAFIAFFPQLLVWKELYGSWFAIPRSNEVRWLHPEFYNMLFSDFHGMIAWSPLFGLGLIGLFLNKHRMHLAVPVLIQIYVYACNIAWWAGGSFGNRRMVGCTPFFILGLAILFDKVPKLWIKIMAGLCALWTLLLLFAEISGYIQLDHYQPWSEIIQAVKQGFLPGLLAHFTKIEWDVTWLERITGFLLVLIVFSLIYWGIRLYKVKLSRHLTAWVFVIFLALNTLGLAAVTRSSSALKTADVSGYLPYDRFTWVVYYEEAYFLLKKHNYSDMLARLIAAISIERRHPEAWMYASWGFYKYQWDDLAYFYACEAMVHGQRTSDFFTLFDKILTEMIQREDNKQYIYYNERGVLRAVMGRLHLAEIDFNNSIESNPDYPVAKENIQILDDLRNGKKRRLKWE